MAGSSSGDTKSPSFDGRNYDYWAIKMETFLEAHDLWSMVEDGVPEPPKVEEGKELTPTQKAAVKDNRMRDAKARNLIQTAVTDEIFHRIATAKTAKAAWEKLKQEFRGDEKVRSVKIHGLRRDFESMSMNTSESITSYVSRLTEVVNTMRTYGADMPDNRIVQKVLNSLPRNFDLIVAVIEETKDIDTANIQEIVGTLRNYEMRLERHAETSTEKAFSSLSMQQKGSGQNSQNRTSQGSGKHDFNKDKKPWKGKSKDSH